MSDRNTQGQGEPRRGAARRWTLIVGAVVIALGIGGALLARDGGAFANMMRGGHGMAHGQSHDMRHHGADGTGHDEVNMPGLQGENATPEESAELAVMFRGFESFTRSVEETANGIRTVTQSSDPDVMAALVSHVYGMIGRVEASDDPQIFIQSPTLDIFFERPEAIVTLIEITDEGIVVTQTSDDPEMVAALHTHAAEVSDMAARGMQAVHESMMGRMGN